MLTINRSIHAVPMRISNVLNQLRRWQPQRIRLNSRRGEGGMIWTILTVSLVAAVAAAFLFVAGPQIIALGQKASTQIAAPPW